MTMQPIFRRFRFLRRCLAWLGLAWLGLAFMPVQAQTYAYRNDVFAYDTPSGTATSVAWHATGATPACTGYPQGDDDWSDIAFPGGFTFTFGGVSYSGVRVYSNGMLAFPTDVSGFHRDYTSQALPLTAAANPGPTPPCTLSAVPKNLMVAYWIDIIAGTANGITGASVKYELLGVAPSRRLVVTWNNVALYGNAATRYSFQIALFESTAGVNGNFRYQYTTGSTTGLGATVGVQLTTTDYTQYAYNQNFIDTTVGTAVLWYPANQLATKSAEYRFDEGAWTGVAGEIKDTSGNSQHASRVGLAASVPFATFPGGKLCRGGSFPLNTLNTTIGAVATPITPGNQGSVDFWFNSNVAWNAAGSAATLLDATTVANRPFFLTKSAAGALTFRLTDTAGATVTATAPVKTFAANTWHHVGIAWNVRAGTNQTVLQIFLDGVLQNGIPTRGTTNGFMPGLSTVYVGDNRTSGITPSGGTPNSANGSIDEVYIYGIEISAPQALADMNLTRANCTSLDHFHIVHDGAVSSCNSPALITIEAHDSTHGAFTLAGTSMNLSTSPGHGTWSDVSGGAINSLTAIGAGTGTATYSFANESSVTFGLSNNLSEALNVNVASGVITEHTGTASTCVASDYTNGSVTTCDDSRIFVCAVPFGFNCVETTTAAASVTTGRLFTKLANTAFAFDVVALKDTNGDSVADAAETLYASDVNKSVTVELVDGVGPATACGSRVVLSPAVTSQTLTFLKANQPTEQGRKSISFTVSNAHPNVRCRVTDTNQTPTVQGCSSDNFAIRPPAVTLNTSANAVGPSVSAMPAVKAGAAFALYATSTAAPNYTGSLARDGSVALSAVGGATPSAALGTLTLTPATISTNPAAVPSGNATYTEVGYLNLPTGAYADTTFAAVDNAPGDCIAGSYLDTLPALPAAQKYGCSITHAAASLGRFIPDHFDTVIVAGSAPTTPIACPTGPPALTCPSNASPSANGFVYANQPFTVQVTARNSICAPACGTTQNYGGTFAKTTALTAWNAKGADPAVGTNANPGGGTLAGTAPAFTNGIASVVDSQYGTTLPALLAPTDVFFRAAEVNSVVDGVTSRQTTPANSVEAGLKIASGRIKIPNAYGSEKLLLPMVFTVQYFNGGNTWLTSTTDSTMSFNSAVVASGGNLTAGVVQGSAGCVTVNSPAIASVVSGLRTVSLAASSAPCGANISLSGTPTYLPIYPATTGGRATFGIFKSPLIYRRENY